MQRDRAFGDTGKYRKSFIIGHLILWSHKDMATMSTFGTMFGQTAHIVVLQYLIRNRDQICYLSGIAEATGLSHSSVARVMEHLAQQNIVKENNIGKKMRTFTVNEGNEALKLLLQFYDDLDGFVNR